MEFNFAIKKDQLTELFGASLGAGKLKNIKVRTPQGLIDFEELVFVADMPLAVPNSQKPC